MKEINNFLNSFSLSKLSQDQYERVLIKLHSEVEEPGNLDAMGLREWLYSTGWGDSMRWVGFCVVRKYLRWKYGEDHPALVLRLKREPTSPQRVLKMKQVIKLLESFDTSTAKGRRDLAICTLALDTGLRAAEICSIELKHVDLEDRKLKVKIKGGRWSSAVYSPYTANCLMCWIADRADWAEPGERSLFVGLGGATPGRTITASGLRVIMRHWAEVAGLEALSPHDLRRTFATLAIRAGAPSRVVQAAGRWKRIEMVEHYTASIEPEDMDGWFPVEGAMSEEA